MTTLSYLYKSCQSIVWDDFLIYSALHENNTMEASSEDIFSNFLVSLFSYFFRNYSNSFKCIWHDTIIQRRVMKNPFLELDLNTRGGALESRRDNESE